MKFKKLILLVATVLCLAAVLLAAVACSDTDKNSAPATVTETDGSVLMVEEGMPEAEFGNDNDICIVSESGDIYRKLGSDWVKVEFESYDVKDGELTVTYKNGSVGVYNVPEAKASETCEHAELSEPSVVYEAKCVIPGIGVRTCTSCKESFAVIIPADGETHAFDAEHYGKCDFCGNIKSGVPGFEVKDATQLAGVFAQVEDGDTIVVETEESGSKDITIDAAKALNVKDKDITLDVNGHDVAVKKDKEEGKGLCVNGGSITITDSKANGEKGKFTLNVEKADNFSNREDGDYAMFMENADLTITNVDFEIINKTDNNSKAMYVSGGNIEVKEDATITMKQDGENEAGLKTMSGFGIFLADGAEMTLDGADINSDGPIIPIVVGKNNKDDGKTVLNLNAGTEIHYSNSAASLCAIWVYPTGVVNMKEGSKISIDGDIIDPQAAEGQQYSNAMAFNVTGGGTVNMEGGAEIYLSANCGTAYAFFIINNTMLDTVSNEKYYVLDAHCNIGKNAKIIGDTAGKNGGVRFFAAQRNGREKVTFTDLELAEGDDIYSVVIEDGAKFILIDDEGKKENISKNDSIFAETDEDYPGTGQPKDHLGWFTSDAINDERVLN